MAYYSSSNPLAEAIAPLVDQEPPPYLAGLYFTRQLSERQNIEFADWCSLHTVVIWATGESLLDAADLMVERAIENGNIPALKEKTQADQNAEDLAFLIELQGRLDLGFSGDASSRGYALQMIEDWISELQKKKEDSDANSN